MVRIRRIELIPPASRGPLLRNSGASESALDSRATFVSRAQRRLSALLAGVLLLGSSIPAGGSSYIDPAQSSTQPASSSASVAQPSASEESGFLFKGKEPANNPPALAQ